MVDYNCRYCHSKTVFYKVINDYRLVTCSNCNLLQTVLGDEKPVNINKKIYTDLYLDNYSKKSSYVRKRFIQRINEIEQIKKGGILLDVGVGNGLFLKLINSISRFKWTLYGVDINKNLIRQVKKLRFVHTLHGSVKCIPFKNKFDVVTCFDVLEHDVFLKENIQRIYDLLKNKGLLFIQVPNYQGMVASLLGIKWDWWSVPDHVYHFTPETLRMVLKNGGFSSINVRTWDPKTETIVALHGFIKQSVSARYRVNSIIGLVLYPVYYFIWLFCVFTKNYFNTGSLIIVSAIK